MAGAIAGMTVSLGGFGQDAEGSAAALYTDLADLQDFPYMQAMQDGTGAGLRLFDGTPPVALDLEELGVDDVGARTSLRFRVLRSG
jgi:hypothetical protein